MRQLTLRLAPLNHIHTRIIEAIIKLAIKALEFRRIGRASSDKKSQEQKECFHTLLIGKKGMLFEAQKGQKKRWNIDDMPAFYTVI